MSKFLRRDWLASRIDTKICLPELDLRDHCTFTSTEAMARLMLRAAQNGGLRQSNRPRRPENSSIAPVLRRTR